MLLDRVVSGILVLPKHINANYKSLACPCPESRNHHHAVETPIFNSELEALWREANLCTFLNVFRCAREDTSTSYSQGVRGGGAAAGSRASLGGAPGSPAASAPGVPPTSGSPWVPSPGAAGCGGRYLRRLSAWAGLARRGSVRPFCGSIALPAVTPASPKPLRKGPWRRLRALGRTMGSHRTDFSRGFSTAPPVPVARPPFPQLPPRLPLWLRSGGSYGHRLGYRRLSALSSPSCPRGGGLRGRLRGCRAGPSPVARTTRGPWLRRRGGGGAGVSWASPRRRAGGWLASCATSCTGTPEQTPRSWRSQNPRTQPGPGGCYPSRWLLLRRR